MQTNDSNSILNAYREVIAWRKKQTILLEGDIEFIERPEPVLAFYKTLGAQKMLYLFNLSSQKTAINMPTSIVKEYNQLNHHST